MQRHNGIYNILIADDHPLFRKGLEDLLKGTEYNASNFLSASNGLEAVESVQQNSVDLLFLDISMPKMNGFEAAESILKIKPHLPVIVLTSFDEIPLILNFLKIGAKGFLTKNIEVDDVAAAIKTVLKGDYYYHSRYDETISQWLVSGIRKKIPTIKFSAREMQMILLMSKGKTTQEISEHVGLSFRSIETYRYQLIKKINVKNTAELISYVYKNNIL